MNHAGRQRTGRTSGRLQRSIDAFHAELVAAERSAHKETWLKCAGIAVAAECTLAEGRRAKAGKLLADAKALRSSRPSQ